jgi:hypothetical protein
MLWAAFCWFLDELRRSTCEGWRRRLQGGSCLGIGAIMLTLVPDQAAALTAESLAKEFRAKWPWHLQTISYAFAESDGGVHFLLSEPPDFLSPGSEAVGSIASVLGAQADVRWFKAPRGMNGWVRDLVVTATYPECESTISPECKERLEEAIAELSYQTFGTAYKAHGVPFNEIPSFHAFSAPDDLQVDLGGFAALFRGSNQPSFNTWSGDAVGSFESLIGSGATGTFYSDPPGIVAFAFATERPLDELRDEFRQFALDSDILLGGALPAGGTGRVILLGREREAGLFEVPPLRFEDLAGC